MTQYHRTAQGRRLAYDLTPGARGAVAFLHGFRSDRNGTKALALEDWCQRNDAALLRFDLSGHGDSGSDYPRFGIGDWLDDARDILDALLPGPAVLVGSSLGGWLALLLARECPQRCAGLVTVAAAPDFTTRLQREMTEAEAAELRGSGMLRRPSAYGGDDLFSQTLFDQGAAHRLLVPPLHLPMPVRMLQGTADEDVPVSDALALLEHATGDDIRLTLIGGADHRLSQPAELALLTRSVAEVMGHAVEA